MNEQIPPITDPLGKSWRQPDPENVLIDDDYAVMTAADAGKLFRYDYSIPDGVYPGKMWCRIIPAKGYCLLWFSEHPENPDLCRINARKLLIVE